MTAADVIVAVFGWCVLGVALGHIWGRACRGRDIYQPPAKGNSE